MGMFNDDLGIPFSEKFGEDEPFQLDAIEVGPTIPTSYGTGTPVILTIDGERYSLFGDGVLNQARNVSDGDLPMRVMLTRKETKTSGRSVKLLVPATSDIPSSGPASRKAGKAKDDIPF